LNSDEIRSSFLSFFETKGHKVLPSASLIPDDPQLLFTVAGMVPFKPIFWGKVEPIYRRVATCQKCLRTNDIENVGRTPRHHTFFEMLGNFSFGDYFKKEAILWAWEYVTRVLKLEEEKLWVTIYKDDDEAFAIWRDLVGVPEKKIIRMGKDTNFWGPAGPTGPCGPCSEIHYDLGVMEDCPEGVECTPANSDRRFLEIWNLVFTEFYQDEKGQLYPLPRKNIDTGAGLERIAAVVQGVSSNFETDLFKPIIRREEELFHVKYGESEEKNVSLRVIADHARAVTFLIGDGVFPSNEERGYVLRRILRRAVRHGVLLGASKSFLHEVCDAVIERMGKVYPEIEKKRNLIRDVTRAEEERFFKTILQGLDMLNEILQHSREVIDGESLFKLYDTYGFPPDIVVDVAKEKGLKVDLEGFERLMEQQRERSRISRFDIEYAKTVKDYEELTKTQKISFVGYERLTHESTVLMIRKDTSVDSASAGEKVEVVVRETPFYAERGGQVSDVGWMKWEDGEAFVEHAFIPTEGVIAHVVRIQKGTLKLGQRVSLIVDEERRKSTARNHTATHLLHAALKKVLGDHVRQFGSLVAPDRLRFDFTHYEALSEEQLTSIEDLVNQVILEALPVKVEEKSYKEAVEEGAIALFGEKYGDIVRVVKVPNFSEELCGGTHVSNTGNIGLFKIISETAVSAGVRRIEAVTGFNALKYVRKIENTLQEVAELFGSSTDEIRDRVKNLIERNQQLEKEIEQLKMKTLTTYIKQLPFERLGNVSFKVVTLENVDSSMLRNLSDVAIAGQERSIVALFAVQEEKVNLIVRVTKDLTNKITANELARIGANLLGGGGGRSDFAQAGGKDPRKIDEVVSQMKQLIMQRI